MLHEIYYNIGVVEVYHKALCSAYNVNFFFAKVQDQIDVTKQLVDLYPFIDKSRVGSTLVCLFCTLPTYIFTRLPFGAGVTVVS